MTDRWSELGLPGRKRKIEVKGKLLLKNCLQVRAGMLVKGRGVGGLCTIGWAKKEIPSK